MIKFVIPLEHREGVDHDRHVCMEATGESQNTEGWQIGVVCVSNEYTMTIMNKHSIEVWFAQTDDSEKRKLRENRCRDRYR